MLQQVLAQLTLGPRVNRLFRDGLVVRLCDAGPAGTLLGDGVEVVLDQFQGLLLGRAGGEVDAVRLEPFLGVGEGPGGGVR
jgi:hypothetical protein